MTVRHAAMELVTSCDVVVVAGTALLALPWTPLAAQDACPATAGPGAEAGLEAYAAGEIATARDRFDAALALCPHHRYAQTGLGYVLLRSGDDDGAAALFQAVVASDPENVDALLGLGLARWRAADLEAVHRLFTTVLGLVPDHRGDPAAGGGHRPEGDP